ncbi:AEL_collapsed_G0011120.mRNA.1.CDS.1 [Saccharomyces cerevisiae]|nr:AGK_G0011170.mRNA.1.CDS.1 [Saccharomyces cerevisiae]CAI5248705.1 AEL_HP2_G0009880.mRNA.1.CDS.1 [Saccharomyces cerevisiae]CAI5251098.1 BBF_HP2_G0011130.mRNA.1.CDS.1 [Saccharomyces cerevisiae]CAI6434697.1 AEL_HP2_G0009880.mRNA.1.CDS.1 [Saccharomyces cerevisiae]CAI6440940.1 BBF_HP1_G0011110.mRNA.1.CDS.1 [Saccharomyces cerevisiae]
MDDFSRDTENFVCWLKTTAEIEVSPKIEIKDLCCDNQGRAVVATQKIKKDETLFKIPRSSVLSVTTSQLIKDYPSLKDKFLNETGSWEGLIICILYEMEVLQERSRWAPYLKVWNKPSDMNALIFWDDNELQLLKPSLVLERIGKKEAKEMHERIIKSIKQIGGEFSRVATSFEFDNFAYIASIILSYSFDLEMQDSSINENEEEETSEEELENERYLKSMIPLADMLNADTSKCNANLTYDSNCLKMVALRDIEKNEQVYNIYGEHPNSELLRRYGYVEWDGSKYDFGEVLLENIVEALTETFETNTEFLDRCIDILRNNANIQELLEGEEIVLDSYDCYNNGELLPQLILLVQILTILCQIPGLCKLDIKAMERQVERIVKKCLQLIEGARATTNCSATWKRCIMKRLADYPIKKCVSIEKPSKGNSLTREELRDVMARRVLKSEIDSLQVCEETIDKNYKVIPDEKLLTNILKRKLTEEEKSSVKRPCVKK